MHLKDTFIDLTELQLERVVAASNSIGKLPIYIDQEPGLSLFELRAKSRKMKTKNRVEMIIIDYLQLMRGDGYNRETEIASISRGLKALAKSLDVPVIALSQLNSNGEVRESKAIEHDANLLLILDRPDYKKETGDVDPALANTAELKFIKNRDGISGVSMALTTDLSTQRFYEPSFDMPAPMETQFDNPYKSFSRKGEDDIFNTPTPF